MAKPLRLDFLIPAVLFGIAVGVGLFTFGYAKGWSYMTNDPQACANCHVMQGHLDAWMKSSHRNAATCNDCHTPPGTLPKYLTKAENGFHHSLAFTTGSFPDALLITGRDLRKTELACRKCHAEVTHAIDHPASLAPPTACTQCHANVGHMTSK